MLIYQTNVSLNSNSVFEFNVKIAFHFDEELLFCLYKVI